MQPLTPRARRDPAPSRVAYRLHRLWLTPLFRALLRVGLPAFALTFAAGIYLSDTGRRAEISQTLASVQKTLEERPAFMVREVVIEGATDLSQAQVAALLPIDLPRSSFDLDLGALRAAIGAVDAVAGADLRIVSGGILSVRITERRPAVLLRSAAGLEILDAGGHPVGPASRRADYPDLPLVAGNGAGGQVAAAQMLWAAAAPIAGRLRGLVWIGERRWDLVLDRDQRIRLPQRDPVTALERVIALDQARDVLARDVVAIDMRNPQRPTIRMTAGATATMHETRLLEQKTRLLEQRAAGQ